MKKAIKKLAEHVPAFVGTRLSFIDFKYRLGSSYTDHKDAAKSNVNREYLFDQVRSLVQFCEKNIKFYKEFYANSDFSHVYLKDFNDLKKIPVITKADLSKYKFEARSISNNGGVVSNTGGTSGQPLKLLLEDDAYAREWGHMHSIWERLNYKTSSLKLTVRGMNLGDKIIQYNFVHNEFQVNAYCDFDLIIHSLDRILKKYKIEYLHGYPSGIYEFLKQLEKRSPELLYKLKENLSGIFFGSEYPAPIYRTYIENTLGAPSISWYGHTEMAVLAQEKEPFVYYPFQSYGFTESVEIDGKYHLIGTTIHNRLGPLIRYDTGDLIEPVSYNEGILESFKIAEGRIGEFVVDKNDRKISLTALIFGRHHKIFEAADFVQVHQREPGKLDVIVTTQNRNIECKKLFDSSGINMDISFKLVSRPYKTMSGKISLLVKEL